MFIATWTYCKYRICSSSLLLSDGISAILSVAFESGSVHVFHGQTLVVVAITPLIPGSVFLDDAAAFLVRPQNSISTWLRMTSVRNVHLEDGILSMLHLHSACVHILIRHDMHSKLAPRRCSSWIRGRRRFARRTCTPYFDDILSGWVDIEGIRVTVTYRCDHRQISALRAPNCRWESSGRLQHRRYQLLQFRCALLCRSRTADW